MNLMDKFKDNYFETDLRVYELIVFSNMGQINPGNLHFLIMRMNTSYLHNSFRF